MKKILKKSIDKLKELADQKHKNIENSDSEGEQIEFSMVF